MLLLLGVWHLLPLLPRATTNLHTVAGSQHSLAASLDGSLWSWGNGCDGRLGTGTQMITGTPSRVDYFDECGGFIRSVAAGGFHSAAVMDDGQVVTWGGGAKGQLGYGMERALLQTSHMGESMSIHKSLTPRPVACLAAFAMTQVECTNTGIVLVLFWLSL
jgi:alpha-tubulin suppressor-like RCC1 family protein